MTSVNLSTESRPTKLVTVNSPGGSKYSFKRDGRTINILLFKPSFTTDEWKSFVDYRSQVTADTDHSDANLYLAYCSEGLDRQYWVVIRTKNAHLKVPPLDKPLTPKFRVLRINPASGERYLDNSGDSMKLNERTSQHSTNFTDFVPEDVMAYSDQEKLVQEAERQLSSYIHALGVSLCMVGKEVHVRAFVRDRNLYPIGADLPPMVLQHKAFAYPVTWRDAEIVLHSNKPLSPSDAISSGGSIGFAIGGLKKVREVTAGLFVQNDAKQIFVVTAGHIAEGITDSKQVVKYPAIGEGTTAQEFYEKHHAEWVPVGTLDPSRCLVGNYQCKDIIRPPPTNRVLQLEQDLRTENVFIDAAIIHVQANELKLPIQGIVDARVTARQFLEFKSSEMVLNPRSDIPRDDELIMHGTAKRPGSIRGGIYPSPISLFVPDMQAAWKVQPNDSTGRLSFENHKGVMMYNLIVVAPRGVPFSEEGESGAAVFWEDSKTKVSTLIGFNMGALKELPQYGLVIPSAAVFSWIKTKIGKFDVLKELIEDDILRAQASSTAAQSQSSGTASDATTASTTAAPQSGSGINTANAPAIPAARAKVKLSHLEQDDENGGDSEAQPPKRLRSTEKPEGKEAKKKPS